jgi:hypothetical protein
MCGLALDAHDKHIRFRLPDSVLALPDRERSEGTWLSDGDANAAVMTQVPNLGAFVRVLLPVRLTGGHKVTFGTWIGVHPDDLQRAFGVWWEPEYTSLRLQGHLANTLPGWGLLGAAVEAQVLDPDATPFIVRSGDPELTRVLTTEWPHREVLDRLP